MACVVKRRGKWVVDFRDQTGRRRWETYRTRKEADEALARRVGEVKGGAYRAAADLPMFAEVAAAWLEGRRDRAKSTFAVYNRQVRQHLVPAFGPLRIDLVSSEAVERFRNEKRDSKLKAGTVNSLMQRLASVLTYAVKHQFIARNPAAHTMVERVRTERAGEQGIDVVGRDEVYTAEQAHALIAASDEGVHRAFITTALLTGCRSGELLALTWGHVDLERRTLRVARSLSWDRSQRPSVPVFGPPKTDSSFRTLHLDSALVGALRAWKLRSPFKEDSDLVFTTSTGGPCQLSYIHRGAVRAFDRCPDLPRLKLHALRHTFASLLLKRRRPVTQVAKLLGHKGPAVTLKVYSHWFDDAEEENREALSELAASVLGGDHGSKTVANGTA